jgi:hypothetical protein
MIYYVSEMVVLDCARISFCDQEMAALYIFVNLNNGIMNFFLVYAEKLQEGTTATAWTWLSFKYISKWRQGGILVGV